MSVEHPCPICGKEMIAISVPSWRLVSGKTKIWREYFDRNGEMYTKIEYVCISNEVHLIQKVKGL